MHALVLVTLSFRNAVGQDSSHAAQTGSTWCREDLQVMQQMSVMRALRTWPMLIRRRHAFLPLLLRWRLVQTLHQKLHATCSGPASSLQEFARQQSLQRLKHALGLPLGRLYCIRRLVVPDHGMVPIQLVSLEWRHQRGYHQLAAQPAKHNQISGLRDTAQCSWLLGLVSPFRAAAVSLSCEHTHAKCPSVFPHAFRTCCQSGYA